MNDIELKKSAPEPVVAPENRAAESLSGAASALEKPLPRAQFTSYLVRATLLIALFYVYCVLALFLGAVFGLLFAVMALRVPYCWSVAAVIGHILRILWNSLRLRDGAQFHIRLAPGDAPQLFADVEKLGASLGVAPPREIVLETGPNAWVQLKGFTAGVGKSKLGFGFDLLAGLDKNGARAVLAHEMAHAKHVKRGYQGFLMRGLVRLQNSQEALQGVADHEENAGFVRNTARAFAWIPGLIIRRAARFVAGCSRYDEFLADRVAAQIVGPQEMKSALLATHVIDHQADKLNWRDRLLHLDRAPGYTAWLESQLHVPDDAKRLEIEARALDRALRHELSTHPALPDRLAALDEIEAPTQTAFENDPSSATTWLAAPDVTAKSLLSQVEKVVAEAESKATSELIKAAKKRNAGAKSANIGQSHLFKACLFGGIGILALYMAWVVFTTTQGAPPAWAVFWVSLASGLGLCGAAAIYYGASPWIRGVAKIEDLPVPRYADYRAAQWESFKRSQAAKNQDKDAKKAAEWDEILAREDANSALGAQLRAAEESFKNEAALLAHRTNACFAALGEANYEKALVAARQIMEVKPQDANALMAYTLCNAAISGAGSGELFGKAHGQRTDWTAQWATAWLSCLWNSSEFAEPILLELIGRKGDIACLWALLGWCQAHNGKPREALNSRRRALELAQKVGDLEDEACHRFVLAQNLTILGQIGDAQTHIEWLQNHAKTHELRGIDAFSLELEYLRLELSRGEETPALARAQKLIENADADDRMRVGTVLDDFNEPAVLAAARGCFEAVLADEFHPSAKMALSGIAFRQENHALARKLLLEALDCAQKRPEATAHPLSLLEGALNGLRAIDDLPPETVKAFEVHLDAADLEMNIKKLSLLIYARDAENAKTQAQEVFGATQPEKPLEERISFNEAPLQYQPKDVAPPGIYSFKWDE